MRRWWLKVRIGFMWEFRDPYDTFNPEWMARLQAMMDEAGVTWSR